MTFVQKVIMGMLCIIASCYTQLQAQGVSSFNFSKNPSLVSGWTNVAGDPSVSVVTATDAVNHITISSVATTNWVPMNGVCSYDGYGVALGTFFPENVMLNVWFQGGGTLANYNAAVPQLMISGLNKDSSYLIRISASFAYNNNASPVQYTVAGLTVAGSQSLVTYQNTASGITFQHVTPDVNGVIRVYVNTNSSTYVTEISGIQVYPGNASSVAPTVSITHPTPNDIFAEDGNISLNATAFEVGATIAKVEFFANGNKIGESDASPYTMTWMNPDEGKYLITAAATDNNGNSNNASVNISVESLTSFWSMTGNIKMNADSNFIGNVDSVRLAFRTKNIERMSISPLGNVGIGTTAPKAALEVMSNNSGVLLPRLTTAQRNAIDTAHLQNGLLLYNTDSTSFQYYNGNTWNTVGIGASAAGHWLQSNSTTFDSLDNIGIGTSNTQGYKLAVNGNISTSGVYSLGPQSTGIDLTRTGSGTSYIQHYLGGSTDRSISFVQLGDLAFLQALTNKGTPWSNFCISNYPSGPVTILTGSPTTNAVFTPAGNTLIGTTSDNGNRFQVSGNSYFSNGIRMAKFRNTLAGDSVLTTDTAGNLAFKAIASLGSSGHWLQSGSNSYDSLDNIGIGTSNTQGYKLAVNGSIIAQKIKLKAFSQWPDYVFRKDYVLPGLPQVEKYITEHQHLPGLPSAEEVKKDGLELGDNQAIMLKKIEELTLYVIELNKKVEKLATENEELKRNNVRH